MIAYFDASAIVPMLIDEPSSARCQEIWQKAERVASATIVYAEVRAALASAARSGRVPSASLTTAVRVLDARMSRFHALAVRTSLARRAGELAEAHALRGYDAIHLAAAEAINDERVVLVAGDQALLSAGRALGLATADTSAV